MFALTYDPSSLEIALACIPLALAACFLTLGSIIGGLRLKRHRITTPECRAVTARCYDTDSPPPGHRLMHTIQNEDGRTRDVALMVEQGQSNDRPGIRRLVPFQSGETPDPRT